MSATASEFRPFPKIARLSRDCIISEKLDGTNASVFITDDMQCIYAGSRTRWLTEHDDNYGFAKWVHDNTDELFKLGPGHHFGEWWGHGIQRNYGLPKGDRRFSLFNSERWNEETKPACCHVVPVLYRGAFSTEMASYQVLSLIEEGSRAVPGFMDPEGIVVYHTAAGHLFKKTCKGDEQGKSQEAHVKKEPRQQPLRDKSKGGRRVQRPFEPPYTGVERRVNKG